jgi:hypothetical protein
VAGEKAFDAVTQKFRRTCALTSCGVIRKLSDRKAEFDGGKDFGNRGLRSTTVQALNKCCGFVIATTDDVSGSVSGYIFGLN